MLISGREACRVLAAVGIAERQARRALSAGLAGPAIRAGGAVLREAERVHELADRSVLVDDDLDELCPFGVFVARRDVMATDPRAAQLAVLSTGWDEVSPWSWGWMLCQVDAHGALPFVATVAGFVVLGADLVGRAGGRLVLEDPGPWFAGLERRRLRTGPGRAWHLHDPGHWERQLGLLAPRRA